MERSTRSRAAVSLTATFWAGAVAMVAVNSPLIQYIATSTLVAAGLAALLWGFWPRKSAKRSFEGSPGGSALAVGTQSAARDIYNVIGNPALEGRQTRPPPSPWRQADAVLRRWEELTIDFISPGKTSWRLEAEWDTQFDRFESAFGDLEKAAIDAPMSSFDEWRKICAAVRELIRSPVGSPKGKWHYLALNESGVMKRLKEMVERDRNADAEVGES